MTVSLKRFLMIMLGLCFFVSGARAQFYMSGEDPARLSWSQLNLKDFKIIYPKGQDSLAYQYATLLSEDVYTSLDGLNAKPRRAKIPVILHAYSANANAMVAWTPRRMEFFTIPSPEVSNLPWARSLVLHEGRHVGQMLRSGDGFFRGLHYLIGEQSEGLAAAYYDMWSPGFFEGDAVMAETEYSLGGRGRQADFLLPYRAYFADSIDFSYDKWQFGSYKHYIPNEYALGYLKWSASRAMNQAGLEDPSKANALVFDEISRHPLRYRRAYQRVYGNKLTQLWESSEQYYRQYWAADSLSVFDAPTQWKNLQTKGDYAAYSSPIMLKDSSFIFLKSSLSQTSRVVHYDPRTQKIKTLFLTGNVNSPLRASDTHLYWTELKQHPRWQHQSYSVLCSYDLKPHSEVKIWPKYLTKKSLLYHPSPSKDNRYLAMVEADVTAKTRLLILRTDNMQEVLALPMPAYDELKELVWAGDTCLYFSVLNQEGLRLDVLNMENGLVSNCIPPQQRTFQHLSYHQGALYFDADIDASTQIYEYNLENKQVNRLTKARFSASCPLMTDDALYFIDYTSAGDVPACLPKTNIRLQASSFDDVAHFLIDDILQAEAKESEIAANSSAEKPASETFGRPRAYHKLSHLFKFHSWAPLYYDKDQLLAFDPHYYYQSVAPGFSLFTQNDLGTAYGQLGYSYHDGYHAAHARFTYSGLLPVVSMSLDYNDETAYDRMLIKDKWQFSAPRPGLNGVIQAYIPLRFSHLAGSTSIVPSFQYYFDNNAWYSESKHQYEKYYQFFLWQLQASMSRNKAIRDLKSPLYVSASYQRMRPRSKDLFFTSQALFSLKAGTHTRILPHDNLSYHFAHQQYYLNEDTRLLINPLLKTRGFDGIIAQSTVYNAIDYSFPWHLDLSIPGLLYIKRLETNFFAERMLAGWSLTDPEAAAKQEFYAGGVELSFNLHPLRSNFNLNIGLRATLSQAPEGSGVEMILNVPYL